MAGCFPAVCNLTERMRVSVVAFACSRRRPGSTVRHSASPDLGRAGLDTSVALNLTSVARSVRFDLPKGKPVMVRIPRQPYRPPLRPVRRGLGALDRRSAGVPNPPTSTVRPHTVGQVVVLEAGGALSDVVEDLDRATCVALARGPRGVVCDLSGAIEVQAPGALRRLATNGQHPRDWPGVPVAIAGLHPRFHEPLTAMPLGGHLEVTANLRQALSLVLATPCPAVQSLRLAPHPIATRAARDFVNRTLLDWNLATHVPAASLVLSELVLTAIAHTQSDIDVTVSAHRGTVRVAVRNRGPRPSLDYPRDLGPDGQSLTMIARLSSAWGVLPTAEGRQIVWAVLDASCQPA